MDELIRDCWKPILVCYGELFREADEIVHIEVFRTIVPGDIVESHDKPGKYDLQKRTLYYAEWNWPSEEEVDSTDGHEDVAKAIASVESILGANIQWHHVQ